MSTIVEEDDYYNRKKKITEVDGAYDAYLCGKRISEFWICIR